MVKHAWKKHETPQGRQVQHQHASIYGYSYASRELCVYCSAERCSECDGEQEVRGGFCANEMAA